MPETVEINKDLNIIEVRSFGDVAFEHMAESIKKVKEYHEKSGINKVLVDTSDLTSMPPISDIFNLANMFPHKIRIAILISKIAAFHEDLRFGETVALNRGVLISAFDSRDEALKWLHKS